MTPHIYIKESVHLLCVTSWGISGGGMDFFFFAREACNTVPPCPKLWGVALHTIRGNDLP